MPQIGWFEILIIVALAIIVIGPKDFPYMLKKIGSWIGSIKRSVSSFQNQISELGETDFSEENKKESNKNSEDISKNKDE
tara:strand:+ start:222 stop:461 length:240 start_codon:yes stop_codon:yes gene_type:complete